MVVIAGTRYIIMIPMYLYYHCLIVIFIGLHKRCYVLADSIMIDQSLRSSSNGFRALNCSQRGTPSWVLAATT